MSDPVNQLPNLKALTFRSGVLNDTDFAGASLIVSRYPPFFNYSFRLMLMKLIDQLKHQANAMAFLNGKIVAYAGWILVNEVDAERWLKEGGEIPIPNWQSGDAAIVTITVTDHKRYLLPLMRAISDRCAGKKVYAIRSFQDGRQDARRPAVRGKEQRFHHNKDV